APAFGRFAVPAAIFELLAQELICQCVVRFFEIRADAEDSAVDAGLRFAVKERPVVVPLKYEPLFDAVDHLASLPAGGVETEVRNPAGAFVRYSKWCSSFTRALFEYTVRVPHHTQFCVRQAYSDRTLSGPMVCLLASMKRARL